MRLQVVLKSDDPKVQAELRKLKAEVDASSEALWAMAGEGAGGTAAAGGSGVRAANQQSLMARCFNLVLHCGHDARVAVSRTGDAGSGTWALSACGRSCKR